MFLLEIVVNSCLGLIPKSRLLSKRKERKILPAPQQDFNEYCIFIHSLILIRFIQPTHPSPESHFHRFCCSPSWRILLSLCIPEKKELVWICSKLFAILGGQLFEIPKQKWIFCELSSPVLLVGFVVNATSIGSEVYKSN